MKQYTAIITISLLAIFTGIGIGLGVAALIDGPDYTFTDKKVTVRHQGGAFMVQADGQKFGDHLVLSIHAEYAVVADTSWVPKRQDLKQKPILRTVNGDSSFGYVRQRLQKKPVTPKDKIIPITMAEVDVE